jgi:hypothetical protein
MDTELYFWKQHLYDIICRNLTDYESGEFKNINWEREFYDILVDVANNWDIIIAEV